MEIIYRKYEKQNRQTYVVLLVLSVFQFTFNQIMV